MVSDTTGDSRRPVSGQGSAGAGSGLILRADEVHVWRADLDAAAAVVERLRPLLALDERDRADRFHFERDRSRYIVGRGTLRILLGRYLSIAPERVRFAYGPNQKPRLAVGGPWFNLSHSGPIALLAFTTAGEIGIDIELAAADFSRERIAERFFSPAEVAVLRSLPQAAQPLAFLTCWTRKEAFIKARGDGLSLPLDSFDVSLAPGVPAALLRTAWSIAEPSRWDLRDLSDRDLGYVAAAALPSQGLRTISRPI